MNDIFNKFNVFWGGIVGLLTMIFGDYWFLFVGLLVLNTIDHFTGREKAKRLNIFTSTENKRGIENKVLSWVLILISFMASWIFTGLGRALNMDLKFTIAIGYMVLGALTINEFNSIIENLVECGVKAPKALTRGLKVASDILNDDEDKKEGEV